MANAVGVPWGRVLGVLNMPESTATVLAAAITGIGALFVGFVAAYATLRNQDRFIRIEQVTKERKSWREKIRFLAAKVVALASGPAAERTPGAIAVLRCKLEIRLNPINDPDDHKIIEQFDKLFAGCSDGGKEPPPEEIRQFTKRIALLLKQDWERVKWECESVCWRIILRLRHRLGRNRDSIPKELRWETKGYRECTNP